MSKQAVFYFISEMSSGPRSCHAFNASPVISGGLSNICCTCSNTWDHLGSTSLAKSKVA
jgi:hypothetical protein